MTQGRLAILLLVAACDTSLKYVAGGGDSGPADASTSCLEANDHSDYAYIQSNIFGAGTSGHFQQCSFGSCHDSTPAAEADLNLTPCDDNSAPLSSSTCNPSSPSYDMAKCCEEAEYDPMKSYNRIVDAFSGQHPEYAIGNGSGDGIEVANVGGMNTATLTDAQASFDASWVDHSIVLEGSAFSGNRGVFRVTEVPSATQIRWVSSSARAEPTYPGTWKVVVSGAGDSFTTDGTNTTLTDAGADFMVQDFSMQSITIKGATTSANNGSFDIVSIPDANTIVYANAAGVAEGFNGTWRIGRKNKIVVPGDPAASYLMVKLVNTPENDLLRSGALMPQSQGDTAALCEEKIGAIRRWIEGGALP